MTTNKNNLSQFKYFLLCVNILFAINIYAVLIHNVIGVRIPGHTVLLAHVPTILYSLMAWFGMKELKKAKYYSYIINRSAVQHGIKLYFLLCLIMAVQIPLNMYSAESVVTVINDSIVWFLPVVAVFGLKEENWSAMLNVFCWHTAIACIILFMAIPLITQEVMLTDPFLERLNLTEVGGGVLNESGQLAYATPILLLSFGSINSFWRATALSTAAITIWIALIGQFRSGVIFVVLAVAIGILYIPMRVIAINKTQRNTMTIMPFLFVLILFVGGSFTHVISDNLHARYPIVFDLLEVLQGRMNHSFSDSGDESGMNLRIEESRQALSEMDPVQLLLGKGMGATWSGGNLYKGQRLMLHLGLAHLLQRGGVLLPIFALVFPFGIGIYLFFRSRSRLVLSCASLILIRFGQFFTYNIFDLNLQYLLLLLCAGGCLLHFQRKDTPRAERLTVY